MRSRTSAPNTTEHIFFGNKHEFILGDSKYVTFIKPNTPLMNDCKITTVENDFFNGMVGDDGFLWRIRHICTQEFNIFAYIFFIACAYSEQMAHLQQCKYTYRISYMGTDIHLIYSKLIYGEDKAIRHIQLPAISCECWWFLAIISRCNMRLSSMLFANMPIILFTKA